MALCIPGPSPAVEAVLVAGGGVISNRYAVCAALDVLHSLDPIRRVIHGRGQMAERIAGDWAFEKGVQRQEYPADWEQHGEQAAAIRNTSMLQLEAVRLVLAFPGNEDMLDVVEKARAKGIRVVAVDSPMYVGAKLVPR